MIQYLETELSALPWTVALDYLDYIAYRFNTMQMLVYKVGVKIIF